jgi:predicted esterase
MSEITYAGLLNQTIAIYQEKGSLEAYRFVTEHADKVEEGNQAQIYNFKYALASASGLVEVGLQLMREAVLDKGFWYEYEYLLEDDDLKPLHKFDEFHELVAICKEREEKAKRDSKPELEIVPSSKKDSSLLIALHGDQENSMLARSKWNSPALKDYMLAFPQSSQIQVSDGYVWENVEQGVNELKDHFTSLVAKEKVDTDQIIVGGFSAGCGVALKAILDDVIPAKGFIFVAPWLPNMEEWAKDLEKLKAKGITGYIICGNHDDDCYESTNMFVDYLKEKEINHTYKVMDGLDHDYPRDFDRLIMEAVNAF